MARGGGAIHLTINVHGIKELTLKLNRLHTAMRDYRAPLQRASKYINMKTAQSFRYGGAETAWKPLSPITIAKKGSSVILVDTGLLRSDAVNPNVSYPTNYVMEMTVINRYAGYHQFGDGVPQRKFFVVLPAEERQIALFVRKYLETFVTWGK